MTANYTAVELTARLEQISTDPTCPVLLRALARNASGDLPGYRITPPDLTDDAIKKALLVVAGVPSPDRLRAQLGATVEGPR